MAAGEGCAPFDFGCVGNEIIGGAVSQASNDALQELTNSVLEGFGKVMATIGTMWVSVPTPVLTAGDATADPLAAPPGSDSFTTILSYVTYIGLSLAVLSLIALGVLVAIRSRRGDGMRNLGSLGIIFIAVMLISGASALVGGLLGATAPEGSSSAVGFLQNSLWYYVGALAVLSVIIGGIRMVWEQRAQPGKDLLQSLITLVVVSGTGLAVLGLGVAAADAFSIWVLDGATDCGVSVAGESTCFGTNLATMLAIGASVSPGVGLIGTLILASLALFMTYVQVALMVVRGGLLVILAGVLPLTASFTNTQMGKQWFGKVIGWSIAFILYKPAAALIYAAAFQLVGSDAFQDDGEGLWAILTGLALMLMALVALPALLKFAAPMTGAVSGGGSAGMAMAAAGGAVAGELATGAMKRMSSASQQSSGGGGGGGPTPSPTGSNTAGGSKPASPAPPPASPAATPVGSAATPVGSTAATSAGSTAAGSAALGGSAATAGGAAAAGPAAPIVAGAKIAGDVAKGAANTAKSAVQGATEDSSGPSGS
jgi:type IV secretion system protein TrbL